MKPWRCATPCPGLSFEDQAEVVLLAQCVLGEAEGESPEGKLAVAYVVMNRVANPRWPASLHGVVLQPWQFSCFNAGSPRRKVMADPRRHVREEDWTACFWAALNAMWRLEPDPTGGATHYLNIPVTLKINGGRLPSWAASPGDRAAVNEDKVTARLGEHTFLRA